MFNKVTKMLVLLLIILKEAGPTAACSSSCSSPCDCSSRGLSSVPQDLPTNITSLELQSNVITTLSQSDFSRYSSLTHLQLHSNQISVINSGAFYNLTRLTSLTLNNNNLPSLRADMFVGLDNLETLTLYDNRMETLPSAVYDMLASISTVIISNNPWQCDYRMCLVKQKMNGSYLFESQIICAGPSTLAGKGLLLDVNPNDLTCEETTAIYSTTSTSSSVDHSTNFPLSTTTGEGFSSLSTSPIPLLETATATVSTSQTTSHSTIQQSIQTTSQTSIQPTIQATSQTTTPEDVHSRPGVADGDAVPPACSCSQSVLLSGFTGAVIGTLLTSAVFLAVWWHHRMKTRPTPAPDSIVVYNSVDSAATVTTRAPDDVAGGSQPITAHRPDPYDPDLSYRLVRPHLPPIEGAAADSSDASNHHDLLRNHFIHQQN